MMRFLAVAALLLVVAAAQADRYALLVAIDSYPIVKDRQLSGSAYDLRLMSKMLDSYGFKTEQLARSNATRQAIVTKMSQLAAAAKAGDDFVFYFSGRGSIAPSTETPTSKVQMEPTLVPYDGKETVIDFDLRMKRVEVWAKEITDKGASVTIIVDASFQSATRDDVGRPYNPTPRTIRRRSTMDGEVREEPYRGPGIYLAATPSGGSAYEYLVNASKNTWAGAFTDMLVNEVLAQVQKGEVPTYSGAMREVQAYFKDKVRQDYMPGLSPYPFTKTLVAQADVYDKPMFGGVTPSGIPPAQKAEITQMVVDQEKKERKLRIGLSFPSVRGRSSSGTQARDLDDMEKERDPKLVEAMTKYVAANLPYAEVQPPGAPIDLIVSLSKPGGGGLEARITGDEVDRAQNLRFSGGDVPTVMKAGLSATIERKALINRLFKLLDDEKPTWTNEVNVTSDKSRLKPNDEFKLTFQTGEPALLYIFDRDDADGIVQLTYPAKGAEDNRLEGQMILEPTVDEGSPQGKMMVRALFLEPVPSVKIPAIGDDTLGGLLKQLRVIVPAIESKKLRWTTKELSLAIVP
jgi:hypothetical protein